MNFTKIFEDALTQLYFSLQETKEKIEARELKCLVTTHFTFLPSFFLYPRFVWRDFFADPRRDRTRTELYFPSLPSYIKVSRAMITDRPSCTYSTCKTPRGSIGNLLLPWPQQLEICRLLPLFVSVTEICRFGPFRVCNLGSLHWTQKKKKVSCARIRQR